MSSKAFSSNRRNRYLACRELGIDAKCKEFRENGVSLLSFLVSMNLKRRHLTSSQKAAIAVDILPLLEKEAEERRGARTDLVEFVPPSEFGKARGC